MLEGVVLLNSRLEHAFGELNHHVEGTSVLESLGTFNHDAVTLEIQVAIEMEPPDATAVGCERRAVGCHDGHTYMGGLGTDALV